MEIVINLPEATYRAIKDVCKIAGWPMDWEAIFRDVFWEGLFRDVFWAIDGGRVLPKGHGRLTDADEAIKTLKSLGNRDYRREKGTIQEAEKMLSYTEYTPTIIEADGGDAE